MTNGAVIARCSQPEVGWLGWRSQEDENLLHAIGTACAMNSVSASLKKQLLNTIAIILGDPGAVSGGGKRSKRARKNFFARIFFSPV